MGKQILCPTRCTRQA